MEEGGGGRRQEVIRNSRQKQPTLKSLSNLIGVIESFQVAPSLSRRGKHSYEICPHPTKPTHNDVCNHISAYWTLWAQ